LAFLLDRKITQLTYEDRCLARVQGIISKVEKGGDYQFLARVLRAANNKELEYDPIPFEIILTDFCLVLARFSKNGELLVGLRNGVPVWKGVKIEESPYEGQFLAFYEGIIPIIDCIGEKELDLIPENPMSGVSALKIAFPMITKTTDRILEDAYFNQRFSIHPDGAMITFEDARDVREMKITVINGMFISRMMTGHGEDTFCLDLNYGGQEHLLVLDAEKYLSRLLAQTYHDLVTAIDVEVEPRGVIRTQIENEERPERPIRTRYIGFLPLMMVRSPFASITYNTLVSF